MLVLGLGGIGVGRFVTSIGEYTRRGIPGIDGVRLPWWVFAEPATARIP
jgi:hypothetical protein